MAVAVIGDSKDTIDGADGTADTRANNTAHRAAYGTGDAITLVRAFLGATHDALGMAGLRHASQAKNDDGACEKQANG